MIVYCVLHLSYFVQSIILRYLKKKKKEKLLEVAQVVAGFAPRTSGLWIPHSTAELPEPTVILKDIKYVFISNMAETYFQQLLVQRRRLLSWFSAYFVYTLFR